MIPALFKFQVIYTQTGVHVTKGKEVHFINISTITKNQVEYNKNANQRHYYHFIGWQKKILQKQLSIILGVESLVHDHIPPVVSGRWML